MVNARPNVHRIGSTSSRWEMLPHTSIVGMCKVVCHQRAFAIPMAHEGWGMMHGEMGTRRGWLLEYGVKA
jgi:hypothetical protein